MRGAVEVDGRPLFPLLSWAQCAGTVEETLALGVNVFMGDSCDDPVALSAAIAGRAHLLLDYRSFGRVPHDLPGLIGWHQPDEPDGWGIPPAELPAPDAAHTAGQLVFLTLTSHFASGAAPPDRFPKSVYRDYVARADVVGFDLYPVAHYCEAKVGHTRITIDAVYAQQRELADLAPGKPTFQWIELNDLEHWCPGPTAAQVRAEIWLAIAGGARGLGYFTHGWPGGVWTHLHVAPEIRAEVSRAGGEIAELAGVLLAPWSPVRTSAPIRASSRRHGGSLWVLAVNPTASTVPSAILRVKGLRSGRAVAWRDAGRRLPVRGGAFRDAFAPYEVHVYRLDGR